MSDTISKIPFLFVGDHLLVCANKNSVEEEDRCMTLKIQVFGQQYFGMLYSLGGFWRLVAKKFHSWAFR